jgi:ATP-dependent helicase/nuclease subunit A
MSARRKAAAHLTLVGASAGSGKTFRITEEVTRAIAPGPEAIDLEGLVGVTYTRKAAGELNARIRRTLVERGAFDRAQRLPLAYLGTVHGVCLRLLQEFAIDAGLSPHVEVVPGSEARLLRQALEWGLDPASRNRIQHLADGLEIHWDALRRRTDWLTPVEDIMTLARSNRIAPGALGAMGERSASGLLALLGKPQKDGHAMDRELVAALEKAVAALAKIDDGQKNTACARQEIEDALRQARRGPLLWSAWAKLQKVSPGKSAKDAVAPLTSVAARVEQHPQLHADLREYTRAIFKAAEQGLAAYDEWKKRRRVVDLVDMIDRALTLLEHDAVAAELRGRLRLLVVDEFQDTSPVQLALFVRLHALAGRSTWVGDRKQCIFEFAGADPTLMEALTRWVDLEGGDVEQLPHNRRSRPELVEACSRLFAAAFAKHGYLVGEVTVTAKRVTPKSLAALPPFGFWGLDVKKQEHEAEALAEGVRRLLEAPEKTPVVDRATDKVRDLRPGDVALLVATNAEAERIAEALAVCGVRATVARVGLLATPEGTLVGAALRALVDPRDALSRATIEALTGFDGQDPEAWLDARMMDVAARRDAKERGAAPPPASLSALVARMESLAGELEGAAPSEALDRVLAALDVVTIACRWPDPEQRVANIDALRAMAGAYEARCGQERAAATVAGLLRYFDEAAEKIVVRDEERASDEQHVGAGDGAVAVLTYHRAKGLEWPVVVLASLDRAEKRNAFEVSPETDRPEFDPEDPLAGRWIRYWAWPFGAQRKVALADVAASSAVGVAVAEREEKERVRLLYVGFTRARDHLVLAARVGGKGPEAQWLDELCDDAGRLIELPAADGVTETGVLGVRGLSGDKRGPASRVEVSARVWKLGAGGDKPGRLAGRERTTWFARPEAADALAARLPYRIAPSRAAEEWMDVVVPIPREASSIGDRLPLGDAKGVSWNTVGDAVHAFLAADMPSLTRAQRTACAERILNAAGLLALLAPEALLRAGDQLRLWVDANWPGATWHREYPVSASIATTQGPRRVSGAIDLVLMTKDGAVVVDHKSFPGAPSQWMEKAREFAQQMGAYTHVLEAAGVKVRGQWVHFTLGAGVVRLV